MLKIEKNVIKQPALLQKLYKRASKLSRQGINAVLLREHFQQEIDLKVDLRNLKICFIEKKQTEIQSKTPQSATFEIQQFRLRDFKSERSSTLHRNPSERLPFIHRSSPSQEYVGARKMKSESDIKGSKGKVSHGVWKYPPRLSEKALRFFAIVETEARRLQKSSRT